MIRFVGDFQPPFSINCHHLGNLFGSLRTIVGITPITLPLPTIGWSYQDTIKSLSPSILPHLSFSDNGVDLKSPARCPLASDLNQPFGKGSLFKVVHDKSSSQPEHSRGTSPVTGVFSNSIPPFRYQFFSTKSFDFASTSRSKAILFSFSLKDHPQY